MSQNWRSTEHGLSAHTRKGLETGVMAASRGPVGGPAWRTQAGPWGWRACWPRWDLAGPLLGPSCGGQSSPGIRGAGPGEMSHWFRPAIEPSNPRRPCFHHLPASFSSLKKSKYLASVQFQMLWVTGATLGGSAVVPSTAAGTSAGPLPLGPRCAGVPRASD